MKYILFKGSMNPKSPMAATDNKLKELRSVGYKQGKDYDIVSLKVLEDTLGKFAGGGMMDINTMTAPLGYALGGPAGMMEPERKSAQPVTMSQIMRDMEASKSPSGVTHPVQKVISDKTLVDPYSESQGERLKELGSKGLEGIKGLSSKGVNVLRQLLGSKSAEAGVYIPDETLDVMSLDEIVREIELLGPPMFGMSVGPNYVQHLRDLANALEKKIEE